MEFVRKSHEFEAKALTLVADADQLLEMNLTSEKRMTANIETLAHKVHTRVHVYFRSSIHVCFA